MIERGIIRVGMKALGVIALLWVPSTARAVPLFARQYQMSCIACHAAFPRLNAFGESFRDQGNRLADIPSESDADVGDSELVLPREPPFALRIQSFVQAREADDAARFDFQTPYLLKLISGGPIKRDMSYYLYAVFAERGENGVATLDDAWLRHNNLFDSGIGVQIGQFQISELMFARELRTTFQDFLVYRMAGLTYHRGIQLQRQLFGGVGATIGFVNGNGTSRSVAIDRPGHERPDRSFDDNSAKSGFGRFSVQMGRLGTTGLFGLLGQQESVAGEIGDQPGTRRGKKAVLGLDLSGRVDPNTYWFGQILWNRWEGALERSPELNAIWLGGFVGVDHVISQRWMLSGLLNWTDAGQFDGSGTVYEGLDSRVFSVAASYYPARNLRALVEIGLDLQSRDGDANLVGHEARESYLLFGVDAAI